MPISSSNNSQFSNSYQSYKQIPYGTWLHMGWDGNENDPNNPGGNITLIGLGWPNDSGETNTEEYMNVQMQLTQLDNLIVPFTIAVANYDNVPGNFGALGCSSGSVVTLEGTNNTMVPLCSTPLQQQFLSGWPGAYIPYIITFLNNNQQNLYMSSNGSYGNSGSWNIYYGPYSAPHATGTPW